MDRYPIVILHGWNLSAVKFLPLQKEFKKRGYKTICIDLPGFGSTKLPNRSLTLSDYVLFIEDYLKRKKINKVNFIGHSFGGRIGIKLAFEGPQMVHSLILTGTPGINPVPKIRSFFFLIIAKIGKVIFSLPFLSFLEDRIRCLLYRIARATDFYNTNKTMKETFKNIVREDIMPYLSQINIPTLLLWGEEDKIVPVGIAQKMKNIIRDSKLIVIPNARHGLPWTHPELFVNEVEEFLTGI